MSELVEIVARGLCRDWFRLDPDMQVERKGPDQPPEERLQWEFARGEALAALRAIEGAGYKVERDWQPIETAPRDGTWILVYYPRGVRAVNWGGAYHVPQIGTVNAWCLGSVGFLEPDEPTHWRPLPAAPTVGEAE